MAVDTGTHIVRITYTDGSIQDTFPLSLKYADRHRASLLRWPTIKSAEVIEIKPAT